MARNIVDQPKYVQTAVTHTCWLKKMVVLAKTYVPKEGHDDGVSANTFFAMAGGVMATHILKSVGIYDKIKENYVAVYGEVEEYSMPLLGGVEINEEESGSKDPLFEEAQGMPQA